MKQVLHKILSISMAVVVIFTTMSFTVDMHYCGNNLVDFSLFNKANGCGLVKKQSIKSCDNPEITKKSCCSNKQVIKEGMDNLKISFDTFSLKQQKLLVAFLYSYINLFEGVKSEEAPFENYHRPFVIRDVQVLHQTFLI